MHFVEKIGKKDKELIKEIGKELKSPAIKRFLKILTESGSTVGALVIIGFIAAFSDTKALYAMIPVYFFQLAVVEVTKKYFNRNRPNGAIKNILNMKISGGSFPSGHTSNVFTLAFLISNYYSTSILTTTALFSMAGLIGLSRVLLGKHYIGDVAAGAMFGTALSIIGSYLLTVIAPLV